MNAVEAFLTPEEEQEIIEAIRQAELHTSGEIRVHLEGHSEREPMQRAREVFHALKMDNTKEENGVLIYVAVHDHRFAIWGDRGINAVVPANFWEGTRDIMRSHFQSKNFKQGLIAGIQSAGQQLSTFFPWSHDDENELPDTLSKS
ncbi:TPM domain-containing protein [Croceiramulus getboli]|nr:TPM domain-containing protein [Flavobacteriaceae bacterium YJPT1-3]